MVTLRGTGKGKGLRNSGSPASTTRAPASAWGTPMEIPQRLCTRPRRRIPPAAASSKNNVSMMVISFSCYHHRCRRFLGSAGGLKPKEPEATLINTRINVIYSAKMRSTGACVGVLHSLTRSNVLLRVNMITRG